jgi:hypothetical protein
MIEELEHGIEIKGFCISDRDGWLLPPIRGMGGFLPLLGGWVASFHFATILVPHSYSKPLQPIAMRLVGLF